VSSNSLSRSFPQLCILVALVACIVAPPAFAGGGVALRPGRVHNGNLPHKGEPFQTFTIRVPEGASRLSVQVEGAGDVDLYVKAGGPIARDWNRESVAQSTSDGSSESVVLTADGIPRLRACTYYVDVVHGDGPEGKKRTFTIQAQVETADSGGAVPLPALERITESGIKVHLAVTDDFDGRITFDEGGERFRTFAIEVAPDVSSVRIDAVDATADMDLYVQYADPLASWDDADYAAISRKKDERLVIARSDTAPLRSGVYYVDLANASSGAANTTFSVQYERGYTGGEPDAGAPLPTAQANADGEITASTSFTLEMEEGGRNFRTFLIQVPENTQSLLVRATGAMRDIDLHLRHGQPMQDYTTEAEHSANGIRANEQLYLHAASSPPLRSGTYYLDIFRPYDGPTGPMQMDVAFNAPAPPPLPASSAPLQALPLDERVRVESLQGAKSTRFVVDVPAGAESLHVSVFQATRDIDLFSRLGQEITSYNDPAGYDHSGTSLRLNEQMEINAESTPPLAPGPIYIDAVSLIGKDEQIAFVIAASVSGPPAVLDDDLPLPPFELSREPSDLEAVLTATVEVMTTHGNGSGTVLSPDGYILTNYHVIERDGLVIEDDAYISFLREFDAPPQQVFAAELVEVDKKLDLALLKITEDVYGRPLPDDLDLPWLPLGDPATLRLGDPLYIAGFPGVGGFESRTSVSVSRGIVSGFVTDVGGDWLWIKTDARINQGNSGGAALSGFGLHFMGVPSMEAVNADDELGYCRPVNRMPQAWVELIGGE
jgi:S1-C subfamily serine protease